MNNERIKTLNQVTSKPDIDNSNVVKHILLSLVNVASSKTSKAYARTTMKALLKELENNYDILRFIKIEDVEENEDNNEAITISSTSVNNIEHKEVGKAIQGIVDMYKYQLGKKAGYFFIREFKNNLGVNYHLIIKRMGVDLRLSDLQAEIFGWNREKYKIKDDSNANIAYIKKK